MMDKFMICLWFKVEARAYLDHRCCSGILEGTSSGKKRPIAQDKISRQVMVEPEGLARTYTHSLYFCPHGNTTQLIFMLLL